MTDSISPLLDASPAELARAVRDAALDPGRGATDPVVIALMWETRQFTHGVCALLASHLEESRGYEPVILEGRAPGQGWLTLHAAVCVPDDGTSRTLVADGNGFEAEILDAAGGGTFRERLDLYREPGWDHRVILARDEGCTSRWMWLPNPERPPSDAEGFLPHLPALAHRLGVAVDLRETLARILSSAEAPGRPNARKVFESGLPEWCGLEPAGPSPSWR